MKSILKMMVVAAVSATLAAPTSFAQDHHDDHRPDQHDDHRDDHHDDHRDDHHNGYVHHNDWSRGHRMAPNDWNRGERIDYRRYHLHAPPRGYEWRSVDGNYVMAAVATGLISSIVVASTIH